MSLSCGVSKVDTWLNMHFLCHNSLRIIKDQISNMDQTRIDFFQKVIQGKEKADVEGTDVFRYLKEQVLGSGFKGS